MPDEKCRKRRTSPCKFPFLCLPVVDKKGEPCCQKGWFGKDCPLPNIEKTEAECVYKPFFKIGLMWITLLRQFLFPASCATAVVYAKSKDEARDVLKTRPSELPLYVDDPKPIECANENEKMSTVEETIGCVRQELEILLSQGQVVKQQLDHIICTASAHTKGTINYLQEEENAIPRFGAIALGSTAGYILALRKGLFKRLLYATAGGLAMASLAYPQEAKEIADEAVAKAKKYFIIGYHLSNGDDVNYDKLDKDYSKKDKKKETYKEHSMKIESKPEDKQDKCQNVPCPESSSDVCPPGYKPCVPKTNDSEPCPPGYSPSDPKTHSTPCPPGYWQCEPNTTQPTPCPPGYKPCDPQPNQSEPNKSEPNKSEPIQSEPNCPPGCKPSDPPPPPPCPPGCLPQTSEQSRTSQSQNENWCPIHGRIG